jgi:predicted RNase H-like HicB family nuclease
MKKVIVNVDWDGNYGASPANEVVCCVVTGKTLPEIKERMEFSLAQHLESMREDGDKIPEEFLGKYTLQYVLTPIALLKTSQTVVTQAALSRATGINAQQLNHYATGKRHPRPAQRQRIITGLHNLGRELMTVEL